MARIRTIKPELWEDQKVGPLDALTALTYIGLISLADDEGRGRADPTWLRSRLHPYRTCTVQEVDESLTSIGKSRLAIFYSVNEQAYYFIPKFLFHQVINKPKPSKLPAPPSLVQQASGTSTVGARAEGKGMESDKESEVEGNQRGKGSKGEGEAAPNPPTGGSPPPLSIEDVERKRRLVQEHLSKNEARRHRI